MQSPDLTSEILFLQNQLKTISTAFDDAIKKDVELAELKIIFHEMKKLQSRLDSLKISKK